MQYSVRRLLWAVPVLWLVATVTFFLMHLAPGNPWQGKFPSSTPRGVVLVYEGQLNSKYGFDKPLLVQYIRFLSNAVRFDWGVSLDRTSRPVVEIIRDHFPVTARIGIYAFLIAVVIGVPTGVMAALRRGAWLDNIFTIGATTVYTIPVIVLSIYALVLFAVKLPLLPIVWDGPKSYILPSVVLGVGPAGYLARLTRASVIEELGQDYVRTARAKGLRHGTINMRHVLRNGLIPTVTMLGPTLSTLVTGSLFVEYIFSIPGTGTDLFYAIQARDYPMIIALTLLYTSFVVIASLLVDIVYGLVDPRARLGDPQRRAA